MLVFIKLLRKFVVENERNRKKTYFIYLTTL